MKPSQLFLAMLPALALALPAAAAEGDAATAPSALEQAGDGKHYGDAAPNVPGPQAPQAGRLAERALEAARGVQRAEEMLTPRQKAEISQALERIERALLDMSWGPAGFFCAKNEHGDSQIFTSRGLAIGEAFSFQSSCERMAAGAKDGLVCAIKKGDFQIFNSRGLAIGGGQSFERSCLDTVAAAREGFVCSPNAKGNYQIFTTEGNPLGTGYSFSRHCNEKLAEAKGGKICLEAGWNYRIYGRNGQPIGGFFDSLTECRRMIGQVIPGRP